MTSNRMNPWIIMATEGHHLRLPLTPKAFKRTLVVVVALNVVLLVGTYLGPSSEGMHWRLHHFVTSFDLSRENNLATWYASMLLLVVAATMFLCFIVDRRAYSPPGSASPSERALSWGWLPLALVFLRLSWDEMGSLHERVGRLPGMGAIPEVEGFRAWMGALARPVGVVVAGMLAFGWARVRQSGAAFALMMAAHLALAAGLAAGPPGGSSASRGQLRAVIRDRLGKCQQQRETRLLRAP